MRNASCQREIVVCLSVITSRFFESASSSHEPVLSWASRCRGWIALSIVACVSLGCSSLEEFWNQGRQDRPPNPSTEGPAAEDPGTQVSADERRVYSTPDEMNSWSREKLLSFFNRLRGDPYPLDEIARHLESAQETVPCQPQDLEVYRGTHLKLAPITVHPALIERITRFEEIVQEVGQEVYGRPASRVRHMGGYACRKSRFRPRRISEHALGNAIDVVGFDFPALPKTPEGTDDESGAELPLVLKRSFQVNVKAHWESRGTPILEMHERFLRVLTERVVKDAVFRVALGPSHRGHEDHFHFDMSPWSYVHL